MLQCKTAAHQLTKTSAGLVEIRQRNGKLVSLVSTDGIRSEDLTLGTGLEYRMGRWSIRGEGQWVDIEDTDKSLILMISAAISFGGSD